MKQISYKEAIRNFEIGIPVVCYFSKPKAGHELTIYFESHCFNHWIHHNQSRTDKMKVVNKEIRYKDKKLHGGFNFYFICEPLELAQYI